MKTPAVVRLACVVAICFLGCRDVDAPSPGPVTFTASLATPNTDDGAVLVELTGPGLANVKAVSSSYQLYWRLLAPDSARAIVIGDLTQGPLLTAEGVGAPGNFKGTVLQVARRDDVLRDSIPGYALRLAAR